MGQSCHRASNSSTSQRNYLLATVHGMCLRLGMNLTDPSLVLSVFVRTLGGSNMLIGLLPTIRFGGWFLPQFLAASWIQPQERKAPISVAMEAVRVLVYMTFAILTHTLATSHPRLLLVIFFVLFSISRMTTGTGALARFDTIGKVIPPSRRASFFATRNFWGGVLVFGAGFLIRYLLGPTQGQPFPFGYTVLFSLSCGCFVLSALIFSQIIEKPDPPNQPRRSLRAQLAHAPALLRQDPAFRRYLLVRILLNLTSLAEPFYTVFALDILGAPASIVGLYLSAMTFASVLSNLLWQKAGRARDTYSLLRTASFLTALTPLLAATLPWLMRSVGFTVEQHGLLPAYLFTAVFLLAGSGESGRTIGLMALLLDISPDKERTSYIGLVNTALGFVSLLPILSGALIDRVGFEPIFITTTGLLLLAYLFTLGWKPTPTPA